MSCHKFLLSVRTKGHDTVMKWNMADWGRCFSDVLQADGDRDAVMWWMANRIRWSDESQRSEAALRPTEGCIWPGWILEGAGGVGNAAQCAGGDGWGASERRTRHEIEWGWRTEKSWTDGEGKGTVRQRWRDWEWGKNEGQRETNLLWKMLRFAPLSRTMASRLNLHLLRQYQVSVSGECSSLAEKPVKVNVTVKKTQSFCLINGITVALN